MLRLKDGTLRLFTVKGGGEHDGGDGQRDGRLYRRQERSWVRRMQRIDRDTRELSSSSRRGYLLRQRQQQSRRQRQPQRRLQQQRVASASEPPQEEGLPPPQPAYACDGAQNNKRPPYCRIIIWFVLSPPPPPPPRPSFSLTLRSQGYRRQSARPSCLHLEAELPASTAAPASSQTREAAYCLSQHHTWRGREELQSFPLREEQLSSPLEPRPSFAFSLLQHPAAAAPTPPAFGGGAPGAAPAISFAAGPALAPLRRCSRDPIALLPVGGSIFQRLKRVHRHPLQPRPPPPHQPLPLPRLGLSRSTWATYAASDHCNCWHKARFDACRTTAGAASSCRLPSRRPLLLRSVQRSKLTAGRPSWRRPSPFYPSSSISSGVRMLARRP